MLIVTRPAHTVSRSYGAIRTRHIRHTFIVGTNMMGCFRHRTAIRVYQSRRSATDSISGDSIRVGEYEGGQAGMCEARLARYGDKDKW